MLQPKNILNLLFPPRCLLCHEMVGETGTICTSCWQELTFITAPQCVQCGLPFEYELGEGALCAECMAHPPSYDKARAVLRYDDASRKLITRFKFSDALHPLPAFATWMVRAGAECLENADLMIPVPLHRVRLFRRRYNQAALMAAALAKLSGVVLCVDGLRRVRRTTPQTGLSRHQRKVNVRGAFVANASRLPEIAGKNIVLVDDVMTTGATLEACVKALKKAGAHHVNIITLAKTLRDVS